MKPLSVLVILGTKREGRRSEHAFRVVAERARARPDLEVVEADVRDFPDLQPDIEHPKFHPLAEQADAFIIVTPEYNRGMPGALKELLDTDYDVYYRKPVGLVGVSSGNYGGRHVVESLLPTMRTLGLVTFRGDVLFRNAKTLFDDQGKLTDDSYLQAIDKMLDELTWYGRALQAARTKT